MGDNVTLVMLGHIAFHYVDFETQMRRNRLFEVLTLFFYDPNPESANTNF
jgi:hypothetical protein